MKSEQEIRNKINSLLDLEKETSEDLREALNDHDTISINHYISKANAIQTQRLLLMWVLDEPCSIQMEI